MLQLGQLDGRSYRPFVFVLTLFTFLADSVSASIPFVSYQTLFFPASQVIDNAWFAQSKPSLDTVVAWADQIRAAGPWSVTNKTSLPRSNDPHDYYSLAVYWWPNCSNLHNTTEQSQQQVWDECEYHQRDGIYNPDVFDIHDHDQVFAITDSVYLSALAYAATNNPIYASHINSAIYTFFVDPSTSMNPNLDYAQVIRGPGNQTGGRSGVIDMERMSKIASGVDLIRRLGAIQWEASTDRGLQDWARKMVTWLTTNKMALDEKASSKCVYPSAWRGEADGRYSNHGSFYVNQLCALYLILNDSVSAIAELERFYTTLYLEQIAASGDQPLESSRTRPFHYLAYNLAALVVNAQMGDLFGLSPSGWERKTSSGATIQDAVNYAMLQDPLKHNETDSLTDLNPVVAALASRLGDPDGRYETYLARTDPDYQAQPYYAISAKQMTPGIQANTTSSVPPRMVSPTAAAGVAQISDAFIASQVRLALTIYAASLSFVILVMSL